MTFGKSAQANIEFVAESTMIKLAANRSVSLGRSLLPEHYIALPGPIVHDLHLLWTSHDLLSHSQNVIALSASTGSFVQATKGSGIGQGVKDPDSTTFFQLPGVLSAASEIIDPFIDHSGTVDCISSVLC